METPLAYFEYGFTTEAQPIASVISESLLLHRVLGRPRRLPLCDVLHSRRHDILHRFTREERLVPGDQHVRESKQTREYIVRDKAIASILEKQVSFLLVNI